MGHFDGLFLSPNCVYSQMVADGINGTFILSIIIFIPPFPNHDIFFIASTFIFHPMNLMRITLGILVLVCG